MRKTIVIVITLGLFLAGCAGTSPNLRSGNGKSYRDISVYAYDSQREYEVLGDVSVKVTKPLFPISLDSLNKLLRKKAYEEYKDVDAIIKVKYDTETLAEGVLDLRTGKSAKGTAVKFIDK